MNKVSQCNYSRTRETGQKHSSTLFGERKAPPLQATLNQQQKKSFLKLFLKESKSTPGRSILRALKMIG